MILPIALLAQIGAPAGEMPPQVATEIVVMAERLEDWRGSVRRRDGTFRCEMEQSSGDTELDEIRCNAMRYCAMHIDGEVQALVSLGLRRRELDARIEALTQRMGPCGEQYEDAVLERLAWERAGP